MTLRVRHAVAADIDAILQIERRVAGAAHWNAAEYRKLFEPTAPARVALVGEGSRGVVGFVVARAAADEWEIENVAVDPAAQRMGCGAALVRELLHLARQRRAACVLLEVRASNEPARRLYEKCGFTLDGRRKGYYHDPAEDALLYRFDTGTN